MMDSIEELLEDALQPVAPPSDLWGKVERAVERRRKRTWLRAAGFAVSAAAAAFAIWLVEVRPAQVVLINDTAPQTDEVHARALHRLREKGELELAFASSSVAEIAGWVRASTGMNLEMARQQPEATRDRIVAVGAVSTDHGVLVSLEIDGQPVSLLMSKRNHQSVAEGWLDKQIHHRHTDGLKTLTWTRDDKAYVLVSDLPAAQTACFACHTSAESRARIERLEPAS